MTTTTTMTAGELAVRSLAAHGVRTVFGIPGTHNLGLYAHLGAAGIRHITPRHEQGAGYAADGFARSGGGPGVAIVTTGPAVLNIAAAVGQAASDSVPMLVLSPGMPRDHPPHATGFLHQMPSQVDALAAAGARAVRVRTHAELASELAGAFAAFAAGPGRPSYIEIPLDLIDADGEAELVLAEAPARPQADPAALDEAVAAMAGAGSIAIVAGGGAVDAGPELTTLAERLGAAVITTINGRGVLPDEHPLALGSRLQYAPARRWLQDADVVLVVGSELGESDHWGPPFSFAGRLVRIELDPARMDANYAADIALVGDAADVLAALAERVAPRDAEDVAGLRAALDAEGGAAGERWREAYAAIASVLDDDAIVAADNAMAAYIGALNVLPAHAPRTFLFPTGFGTLGYALPAAIGAKLAHPDRQVVAVQGDGGLMFTLPEVATAAEAGVPLPVLVFVNEGYGEIRREMHARGIDPVGVDLPVPDFPALARALGGTGVAVDGPDGLARELASALERPGPTLITIPE